MLLIMNLFLQAGTQFWDENLENELTEGRLSSTAFDRYILETVRPKACNSSHHSTNPVVTAIVVEQTSFLSLTCGHAKSNV